MWNVMDWLRKIGHRRLPRMEVDDLGVRRWLPDGSIEQVLWDELEFIDIVTTDDGPLLEDVFWVFRAGHHGCVLPGELGSSVLKFANSMPNWDTHALVSAMGSTEQARFRVWTRDQGANVEVPVPQVLKLKG